MFKDLNNDEHLGIGEEPEPGSVYIDHSFTPHWTGTGMIVIDILCGEHRLDAVNDDGDWWGWVTTTIASEVGPDLVELPLYPKVAGQIWHDLDGDYQNDPGRVWRRPRCPSSRVMGYWPTRQPPRKEVGIGSARTS